MKSNKLSIPKNRQNIRQVPEGYLLTAHDSTHSHSLIINLALNCFKSLLSLVVFANFFVVLQRSQLINLFFIRLIIVFMAIAFISWFYSWAKSVYLTIDQILVSVSFEPPELIFNNYPLSLGEDTSIVFRRKLRSGKIIREAGIVSATLICTEEVSYRQDDSYEFASEKVFVRQLPEVLVPAYESAIEVIFKITIPSSAPSSFEAQHNQIKWMLEVSMDFPKLIKESSQFHIQIQPQLISSHP